MRIARRPRRRRVRAWPPKAFRERTVTLRDGGEALIRQISPSDRDALRIGFERLSKASRYRRFLSALDRLTDAQLDYLTNVDQRDHVAIVAVDPASRQEILGVARFVRTGERDAEPAIAVVDGWQGKGLGTALLRALTARAREEGIERYEALVLAENEPILRLLGRAGEMRQRRAGSEAEVQINLSARPATAHGRRGRARRARRRAMRPRRGARG